MPMMMSNESDDHDDNDEYDMYRQLMITFIICNQNVN